MPDNPLAVVIFGGFLVFIIWWSWQINTERVSFAQAATLAEEQRLQMTIQEDGPMEGYHHFESYDLNVWYERSELADGVQLVRIYFEIKSDPRRPSPFIATFRGGKFQSIRRRLPRIIEFFCFPMKVEDEVAAEKLLLKINVFIIISAAALK